MVLLGSLLEKLQLVLHGSDYEVVLALLVVLRLFFGRVARTLGCLWPFVDLLVSFVFGLVGFLAFGYLCAFVVSGGDDWFPAEGVFAADGGEFKVIGFVHVGVFWAFADGCGCESFFVPR